MCRSAYFQLRTISNIRHMLPQAVAEQLTHAYITSRLDTCNSLLLGLPDVLINKLQRIQNAAARMVTRTKKYDHISPVLRQLHWLPIKKRIVFKVLLLTYKALNGLAPGYLADLLQLHTPTRNLRSAEEYRLSVPRSSHSNGDRAFSVAAPRLWNTLPMNIKMSDSVPIFKGRLKSFLFE